MRKGQEAEESGTEKRRARIFETGEAVNWIRMYSKKEMSTQSGIRVITKTIGIIKK